MTRHWYSRSKLLVVFTFAVFICYAVTSPVNAMPRAGVKLSAGTVVALALEHSIDSEMSVGTTVSFRVIYDVKADDKSGVIFNNSRRGGEGEVRARA